MAYTPGARAWPGFTDAELKAELAEARAALADPKNNRRTFWTTMEQTITEELADRGLVA
jgi:hypothetical protein